MSANPPAAITDLTEKPTPLPGLVPPVKPFNLECLPDSLAPYVEDIATRMSCPVEFPAVGVMTAIGSAIGRSVGIRPKMADNWTEYPNHYAAVVGRPSVMKTPPLLEVIAPLVSMEMEMKSEWQAAAAEYESQREIWKVKVTAAKEKGKAAFKQGDAIAIDLGGEPEKPPRPRLIVNDPSVEKLVEIARDNPRGLLLERDELAGWLAALSKSGKEGDRQFYLEANSGKKSFTQDRIGRGTVDCPPLALSIIGGIQPGPLRAYMGGGGDTKDDGLFQRFHLLVWPEDVNYRHIDKVPNLEARETYIETIHYLRAINSDTGTIRGQLDGYTDNQFLRFTPEAGEMFATWMQSHMNKIRGEQYGERMEAHLSKYRKLVPGLTLGIHLADNRETDDYKAETIGMRPLEKALIWADILETHLAKFYQTRAGDEAPAAHAILEKVHRGSLPPEFAARDIYRKQWKGLTDQEMVKRGLDMLEEFGWIRRQVLTKTGGRNGTGFIANPHCWD